MKTYGRLSNFVSSKIKYFRAHLFTRNFNYNIDNLLLFILLFIKMYE